MHLTKVKLAGGDYKRLVDHMERKHKFYKSDVDLDQTYKNISLKPYERDLKGYIEAKGVTRFRKDSVGAINAVCHVAEGDKLYLKTHPSEYKRWGWGVIDATLNTLNLTRDDLLGAVIHLDEDSKGNVKNGNAHIQFSVVPIVREKDKVSLSAKRVSNKKAFKSLHIELQKTMNDLGFKGQYISSDEQSRGLGKESLKEYKASQEANKKLLEKQKKLTKDIKSLEQSREALKNNNISLKIENQSLKDENNALNQYYLDLDSENRALKDYLSNFKIKGKPMLEDFEKRRKQANKTKLDDLEK